MTGTPAEAFGTWAALQPRLTAAQERLARDAIIDTVACLVLGADDASTRSAEQVLTSPGATGPSTMVTGASGPPAAAASVNATAAHAADFDDNFTPGMSHASAVLVPALLAVAEAEPGRADRLLESYVVGLQAQAYVGALVGYGHYVWGWHGTSTVGCIGTAAAVAHLCDGSADAVGRALGIAVSFAGGTKAQFGTPMKALHAGLAARGAVEAGLLAVAGVSAHPRALEGPQGFVALTGRGDGTDGSEWLTDTLAVERPGVLPKQYPSCGSTHLVLDAIADLVEATGFTASEVTGVEATIGPAGLGSLPYREPSNALEARFSMEYCVRTFLRRSTLALADFTEARVQEYRTEVREPEQIEVILCAWDDSDLPPGFSADRPPHHVRVHLRDGRTLEHVRVLPRGNVDDPFSDEQRRRKFLDCCGRGSEPIHARMLTADGPGLLACMRALVTGLR
ncbi:MmgE/PrpD family protein [Occultella glacieicola]|uniref:MmgE/PrpD family protein n=1 Tax=Occultella glacieicola TaxID=2518684 RepID=A0ABY2DXF6_9MICO|nr:MmgE/PrpD family protein [Occultella glacieicola]TDE88542.1 MmgE/PrpD family protein [Occultella glacieicola]